MYLVLFIVLMVVGGVRLDCVSRFGYPDSHSLARRAHFVGHIGASFGVGLGPWSLDIRSGGRQDLAREGVQC